MIIPLRTNREPRRRPIITELLIALNLLVYLAGLVAKFQGWFDLKDMIEFGHLWRADFHVWQLLTYQFLHDPASIWHLAFNMLFLWVFGCAVEDRLGRASYLGFYIIGGAVAGVAHMMLSLSPVIGASGSIAGVSGAFLALFPRSRIQVFIFFFFVGIYSIPSLWFIGFYFVVDVLREAGSLLGGGEGGVAYMAHIAGYLYGFALAFALLALSIVKREEFDVFYLFKQVRRRAAFRAASKRQTGGLWDSASADTGRQLARAARRAKPATAEEQQILAARAEINELISQNNLSRAAAKYSRLLDEAPEAVFAEGQQLDLANQLYANGEHRHAALAYELLLHHYPGCGRTTEVRLLLGVLYARYLNQPQRAREFLEQARKKLADADQKAMADQLLSELET